MHQNETRILRDRLAASLAARDRATAGGPPEGASRVLLSVYDGGSKPTQPDHVFLAHPVALDCPDTAGSPCTPSVDAGTTIPFVSLDKVPGVGDMVIATHVGGRWVARAVPRPAWAPVAPSAWPEALTKKALG